MELKLNKMNKALFRDRAKKLMITGALAGVIAGVAITSGISSITLKKAEKKLEISNAKLQEQTKKNEELQTELDREEVTENTAELLASDDDRWCLALVNEKHPLDTSYVPANLTEISDGKQVDSRMADSLNKMLDDGKKAGLSMYVTSGYRSYEKQRDVFNTTMQDWINQGYTPLNAYDETKKSVAIPGTSEHATGLAVDIISTKYGELDEKQGDTEEQKWLMEHCSEYGFVLRFPQDKSNITGIIYEPWHYRYVGVDAAKEMTEKGLTLEEYVSAN